MQANLWGDTVCDLLVGRHVCRRLIACVCVLVSFGNMQNLNLDASLHLSGIILVSACIRVHHQPGRVRPAQTGAKVSIHIERILFSFLFLDLPSCAVGAFALRYRKQQQQQFFYREHEGLFRPYPFPRRRSSPILLTHETAVRNIRSPTDARSMYTPRVYISWCKKKHFPKKSRTYEPT